MISAWDYSVWIEIICLNATKQDESVWMVFNEVEEPILVAFSSLVGILGGLKLSLANFAKRGKL